MIGIWKLNEAESKIGAGMAKNTRSFMRLRGDGLKITVDGIDSAESRCIASGRASSMEKTTQ
jgi:hypothetical protein